ncbi:AarF/ABC1/UbiB kinase family protein [Candidatus Woesearchaeota archaeon]|nr:AarF/ABC1/UbiB kinase family protein [Candidatus Woesearchaeota archaeon]MBW3016493.1 AarF/ABC1/UbiB kinase family protein [Candidatus Woesearchaeota archaeon]
MIENVKRITYVIRILNKHGLGGILSTYGFSMYLPLFKRGEKELPADLPKRLRLAMEELGGAYIKLGQLLSQRPDLVPPEYCEEFSKLLDEVPPEKLTTVEHTIAEEFKKPAKEVFKHIDPAPLGSASIAQVHKARLKTGKPAAVKIQRPDTAKKFKADIDIIRYIAQKLQKYTHNNINIPLIVDEFEQYSKKELNFTIEARHIEEISRTTPKKIVIPEVYWTYTTEKVLTMEYLEGTKLSETKKADKQKIAKEVVDAFFEQIFKNGTFHADLHPGNILLLKNGKIGLLDFGIVGHLDKKTRELGLKLHLAIIERDPTQISEVLLSYGEPSSKTNIKHFQKDIQDELTTWWDKHPEQRRITKLMQNMFVQCYKNHIQLPRDTVLLGKGMVTVESTARKLDPTFNFVKYSQPKIEKLLKQQRTPAKILERFTKRSKLFGEAITDLPEKTIEVMDAIKQGKIELHLDDRKFRHLGKDINLSSNRLSYSMIAAALILGGAWMTNIGPRVGNYSMISMSSLILAGIFIIALFISISKEGVPIYDNHER